MIPGPGELHWATLYDGHGDPIGETCRCEIGVDHDPTGTPNAPDAVARVPMAALLHATANLRRAWCVFSITAAVAGLVLITGPEWAVLPTAYTLVAVSVLGITATSWAILRESRDHRR